MTTTVTPAVLTTANWTEVAAQCFLRKLEITKIEITCTEEIAAQGARFFANGEELRAEDIHEVEAYLDDKIDVDGYVRAKICKERGYGGPVILETVEQVNEANTRREAVIAALLNAIKMQVTVIQEGKVTARELENLCYNLCHNFKAVSFLPYLQAAAAHEITVYTPAPKKVR